MQNSLDQLIIWYPKQVKLLPAHPSAPVITKPVSLQRLPYALSVIVRPIDIWNRRVLHHSQRTGKINTNPLSRYVFSGLPVDDANLFFLGVDNNDYGAQIFVKKAKGGLHVEVKRFTICKNVRHILTRQGLTEAPILCRGSVNIGG